MGYPLRHCEVSGDAKRRAIMLPKQIKIKKVPLRSRSA